MGWIDARLLLLAALLLVVRLLLRRPIPGRSVLFAATQLAATYWSFFRVGNAGYYGLFAVLFAGYVAIVIGQYVALRLFGARAGWQPWIAFVMPVALLAAVRYLPLLEWLSMLSPKVQSVLGRHPEFTLGAFFVGLSYLAFRTSHLVLEVRNRVVSMPSLCDYLGFAFFLPTFSVGPISPYSLHVKAFDADAKPDLPAGRALMRLLVGGVKFKYFGPLLSQLGWGPLMLDGHPHLWIDVPLAAAAYYLFLYCNFSGFCDIAIGSAGLMGVPVAENFDNPLAARNVKDFWNRWHITLSTYMRDVVFSPLSKTLVRWLGPANANHAIAITITVVFLLVGIWHGVGWNYAAFGLMHAAGVVTNHYWAIGLKAKLGRERMLAYNRSPWIHAASVCITFVFVSASLFLFANTPAQMREIWSFIQWR